MRHISSAAVLLLATVSNAEAALTRVDNFGTNPGALDMYEYVPAGLPANAPLVVVMHGCTQTAQSMETAGWNKLADEHAFAVVYPQQRTANNGLGCFNWFEVTDIARGQGETASIAQMVDKALDAHDLDRKRVYVTGLSAGGAMTAVMLAAYPDRFRAGSIMAGLPYKCATDVSMTSTCSSTPRSPAQWGELVRAAHPSHTGPYPRVQIWHGSMDYTVPTANATELIEQWTNVWSTDDTPELDETVSTATHRQFKADSGVAVELYLVNGMGHAIATGADAMGACPATSGAFFSDVKICSTLRAAGFFGLLGSGDAEEDGPGGGSGGGDGDGDGGDAMGELGGGGGCSAAGGAGGVGGGGGLVLAVVLAIPALRRRSGCLRGRC